MATPRVSIVFPVYNEGPMIEKAISTMYSEVCTKIPTELLICEDGSTDGTKEILLALSEKMPLNLFLSKERKGYSKALADGLRRATSPIVFMSDSDGQYDPSDFWKLFRESSKYDMVIGWKLARRDPIHRVILSKGFNRLTGLFFGVNLHDIDCGFRIIRKEVIDAIVPDVKTLPHSFWAEFTLRALQAGFTIAEVPVTHYSRAQGKTQIYPLSKIPSIVREQVKGLIALRSEMNNYASV